MNNGVVLETRTGCGDFRLNGKPAETMGDCYELRYRGALCIWSRDVAPGVINFYVGERLAGVTSGWTVEP